MGWQGKKPTKVQFNLSYDIGSVLWIPNVLNKGKVMQISFFKLHGGACRGMCQDGLWFVHFCGWAGVSINAYQMWPEGQSRCTFEQQRVTTSAWNWLSFSGKQYTELNIFQTYILVLSVEKTILAEVIATSEGCNRAEEGKKMAKWGKVYVQVEIKLRLFNLEDLQDCERDREDK